MSVSYYANLVLGFKLPKKALWVKEETRGCDHPVTDPNARFCAQCGAPISRVKTVFLDLRHPVYEQFTLNTQDFEEELNESESSVVFGLKLPNSITMDDLSSRQPPDDAEAEFRAFLAKFKVSAPPEMKLGIHLVRYVSY